MPSAIVKEYVVLQGTSASFTQHLTKPLNDVIKTDLVSITVNTSNVPIIFIQSVNLGGAIQTPDNSKSYWRIAAPPPSSPAGATTTVLNQRVDTYLDAQRNITDIDITLLDSNNSLLTGYWATSPPPSPPRPPPLLATSPSTSGGTCVARWTPSDPPAAPRAAFPSTSPPLRTPPARQRAFTRRPPR